MHFIGGRGRVGFVKELKVVNSNRIGADFKDRAHHVKV